MAKIVQKIIGRLKKRKVKAVAKPVYIPLMEGRLLENRTVFVAGASGGIGLAICEACLRNNAKVILAGRDVKKLNEKKEQLAEGRPEYNGKISVCELSLEGRYEEGLKNTLLGLSEVKIDALVNCIGMSRGDAFRYTEAEDFDAVMQTNIKSTYLISQVFANYFIENSIEGNILNISSVSGIRPANTPYMISKWGMNGLTKGMAKQLIKYGIVVNGIAPGPTATEMLRLDGSNLSYEGAPAKRFTAPAEVGNLAVFLLSDMARMIVGETIAISGGCGNLTYDDIPY